MKKQAPQRTTATGPGRRMASDTALRAQVLAAARQRCQEMNDGPQAREEMKRDVLQTPAELLPGLLQALSSVRIDSALLISTTTKE